MNLSKDVVVYHSLLFISFLCAILDKAGGAVPRRMVNRGRGFRDRTPIKVSPVGYQTGPALPRLKFVPSNVRCCKVGEMTAKKRMSCNLDEHIMSRNRNLVHKAKLKIHGPGSEAPSFSKMLTYKIDKCLASKFSPNFEKCCLYREDLYRQLDECKKLKSGSARKSCRKEAKMRYAA